MQNLREINKTEKRHFKNHRSSSTDNYMGVNLYLFSSFHKRISVHLNIFQVDFHTLSYPYCNLNPAYQNKKQVF
jgi:hypothetical protein